MSGAAPRGRTWAAVALLGALAACDGATDPEGSRLIRVVQGGTGADTVLAVLAAPMIVEVRDASGRPAAGVRVESLGLDSAGTRGSSSRREMYACPVSQGWCLNYPEGDGWVSVTYGILDTTDATGRIEARVQFGTLAGASRVLISVPELRQERTVSFTTRPGALAAVLASVPDTTLYVGTSYALTARAADRHGNARPEPVTLTSVTPTVAALGSGRVTTLAIGRGRVVAQAGAFSDTAFVSVPPRARLAAVSARSLLVLVDSDGSGRREVVAARGIDGDALPSWAPDGAHLLYQEQRSIAAAQRRLLTDTLGGWTPFLAIEAGFAMGMQGTFSAVEQAVYLFGRRVDPDGRAGVFRTTSSGTDPVFIATGTQPAPSPDGSQVAYVSGTDLVVRDVATGAERIVAANPQYPRWSPRGDLIAFAGLDTEGGIRVVRPDGTGSRTISRTAFGSLPSWSPDGEWVAVAHNVGGIVLVRVADGLELPLSGTGDLGEPAWRP